MPDIAENSHGISVPSEISEHVKTLKSRHSDDYVNIELARDSLLTKLIELVEIEPISSTSVRLTWNFISETRYLEGFYIRFRDMSGGSEKFNIITVLKSENTNMVVIPNLRKFTEYEFFLMPFYKMMEGQPSNSMNIQTLEDVPSAPPDKVSVVMVNSTSATLSWSPPPPQHRNGQLLGYFIQIKTNQSVVHSDLRINATTTSITLTNLTLHQIYVIRAVAFTKLGNGPFSAPTTFKMDPDNIVNVILANPGDGFGMEDLTTQTWFIAFISSILFVLVLLFILVIIYRRVRGPQKALAHHTLPPAARVTDGTGQFHNHHHHHGQSDTMWMSNSWQQAMEKQSFIHTQERQMEQEKLYSNQEPSLYAEVGEAAFGLGRHNLSSFGGSYRSGGVISEPAPYATTTLAMNSKMRTLDGKTFMSLPQREELAREENQFFTSKNSSGENQFFGNKNNSENQFFTHKTNSSSGGDSINSELMTPPSDSHFSPDKSKSSSGSGITKLSGGSGSGGGSYIPNWSDLFPPPPAYPPSDSESLANTPRVPRNSTNMDQMSPMGSGGRGNYSSQSPSLAKRATGLQLRQQQDPIAPCHKNIWPNPMQGLPGQDMTYLQSLQAQSFPHIPKTQLAQLTDSAKMDIYENPSEHYASINNYGIAGFPGSGLVNKEGTPGPNFYGYGVVDYETSDYEADTGRPTGAGRRLDQEGGRGGRRQAGRAGALPHRPSSSDRDRWADSSHSETEHDSDNNNRMVKR